MSWTLHDFGTLLAINSLISSNDRKAGGLTNLQRLIHVGFTVLIE
jgi:hypothetical protein